MAEVQFAEPQSLQLTHDKPSSAGLLTRDSGFQELMMDNKIDQTLVDKKLPQMTDNDSLKSKKEPGLLDPWVNDTKDQEDYKSIKFNKSDDKKDDSAEDSDDKTEEASMTIDSLIFDPLEDERIIMLNSSMSEEEKKERITRIFARAASNGNLEKVSSMLETSRKYIDIDAQDEEGTTPLIYAACFGHESVAFTLLEAGAKVDAKDRNGWTPLIWAANSSHDAVVKLLLDHGADATAKTANRRTVFDFMTPEQNPKIVEIFNHNPQRDSWSSTGSIGRWSWFDPSDTKLEDQMAETEMKKRMLMESAYNLEVDMASLGLDELESQEEEEPLSEFMWNVCLPDQMFVFSQEDIPHILKTVVLGMQPIRSKAQKPVPANIIFLSARFAHYYSSSELLESFLFAVIDAIDKSIRMRPEDMTLLSFWISNCTLLLYYLKKDTGLAIATIEYQLRISELLHEIYVHLVKDAQRRVDRVLEASMLEFDTIPGLDDVRFEGEWRILNFKSLKRRSRSPVKNPALTNVQSASPLRRSSSASILPIFRSPPSPRQRSAPSPRNVTSLLSSTLFVLQTYEIHPMIIEQVMNQLFYFMSCELFNKVLSKKKYLCRSKAMQIRLNVSAIEDWVRTNNLSLSLINHFQPLIQLLQLLMCWSQMTDFLVLIQTTKELNLINPAQLKRVSKNYRYEVNEPRITEECQQYILQLEEDTERRKKRYSTESIRSDRSDASSIIYLTVSPTLPPCGGTGPGWEDDDDLMELKDSEMLLPFAIPTSTEMLANYGGQEKEGEFIPLVPDEWMEKLDVGMRRGPSSVVEELTSQWEAEYNEEEDDDDGDITMDSNFSNLQIGGIPGPM